MSVLAMNNINIDKTQTMKKKEIKFQEIETTIAKACKLIDIAQSTLDGLTAEESARLSEARAQLGYAFANIQSAHEVN